MFETLSDIHVDYLTGRTFIDEATGDAEIIRGSQVIIQNIAIRLNTQIGTVKRQGLSAFGWDLRGQLKQKRTTGNIATIVSKIEAIAMQDQNVKNAKVTVSAGADYEDITFNVAVLLIDNVWYSVPLNLS